MKTKYGINIFTGINPFTDKPYFVVDFVHTGQPSFYRDVTSASKKRLENLIVLWDKRVYFNGWDITIVAFNPNA